MINWKIILASAFQVIDLGIGDVALLPRSFVLFPGLPTEPYDPF